MVGRNLAATLDLIISNDWELFGEGEGDFYTLQRDRLTALMETAEKHGAPLTIFSEVGQQLAHLREADRHATLGQIARDWETSIASAISRGHDVQLHYHPTWHDARYENQTWHLNLDTWALADLPDDEIVRILSQGKNYLESVCRKAKSDYRCLIFRAGAFCIQPENRTIPLLKKVGLLADSSVLPGYWDYLHIDFRDIPHKIGPFLFGGITEFPVYTQQVWDSPLLRKIFPAAIKTPLRYGIPYDREFELWKRERDRVLHELCPKTDPLHEKRQRIRLAPGRWPSFFLRRSAIVLDYDFISPGLFVLMLENILKRAHLTKKEGRIPIVALGHANNSHTTENLDRTLQLAKTKLGDRLSFKTLSAAATSGPTDKFSIQL